MIRMNYDPVLGVRYICDGQPPIAGITTPLSQKQSDQILRHQIQAEKVRRNNTKQK